MKRGVDIFGATVALILFSPVMIGTMIAIKVSSPGPLIFKQERVGLKNKPFMMYKFRSWSNQTHISLEHIKQLWKLVNTCLTDEFANPGHSWIVLGCPSFLFFFLCLYYHRTERTQFVEQFKEEIPRYMVKHQVRPGLTGWAQVNGYRGDTSIRKRIDCDLYYVENWTLGLDFKILIMTFFKGFVNKNAY